MMEGLSRASELAKKTGEAKSAFNPDARVEKLELPKTIAEEKRPFDPDARAEKLEAPESSAEEKRPFDPDARVEKDDGQRQRELTQEEKDTIKKETHWSNEVVDTMKSMDEYRVYKDAGLDEKEIDGRKCLVSPNIDMEQKDAFGRTNKERMEQGLAPLDKNGNPMELHHIGQHNDSPLAELTQDQHRGKDNYSILHDTKKESEIDRVSFNDERANHWKARAENE